MLTDVQIGLIGGLSFVVFFVCFGLPIGRLSDRYNRKRIILAGVLIWSAATVLCSFATGFWELLVLRMGVGLGEATLAPCAYSILADIFPRNRLGYGLEHLHDGGFLGHGPRLFRAEQRCCTGGPPPPVRNGTVLLAAAW